MKLCCANVPIVLSEMRIRMEWASDEYCICIAQALKTWTSGGSYSLWPSLEPWQSREIMVSEFQMVFVSDGFGIFWQCSYLSDRSCSMPRFGTVEVGVVCDGLGRLRCFVLQWWEEIRRGRGGLAPRSVRLLQKCGGELQALAMPICIAGPKVGGVSGPTSFTCFLPQEEEGFGGLIFHSSFATGVCLCYSRSYIFWGSWSYRLPSFLMCFWRLRNVSVAYALRIYGSSCPEVPAAYTTFQAWSWENFLPWTNQFEANQIPKRVMKNHGRTWYVRISGFGLSNFLLIWKLPPNDFPGRHKCSSTIFSTSCRGGPSEPLDRWRTHRTPNVAIGAEPVGPSRPIANELGKEAARWKPPCLLHDGTVVQQLNIEPFMV